MKPREQFFFFSFLGGVAEERGDDKSSSDMPGWQLAGHHMQFTCSGTAFETIPAIPNSFRRQTKQGCRCLCWCPTQLPQMGLEQFYAGCGKSLPSSDIHFITGLCHHNVSQHRHCKGESGSPIHALGKESGLLFQRYRTKSTWNSFSSK